MTPEDFAFFAGLEGMPHACRTESERRAWLIGFAVKAGS